MTTPERTEYNRRLELWAKALVSGDYAQAQGSLHDGGGGRCCLGVACEVFKKETGLGRWKRLTGGKPEFYIDEASRSCNVPPLPVKRWFGMDSSTVIIGDRRAIELNDDLRVSFANIASLIHEHLIKENGDGP